MIASSEILCFPLKKRWFYTMFIVSKLDQRPRSILYAPSMGAAVVACSHIDDSKLHGRNKVDPDQSVNLSWVL